MKERSFVKVQTRKRRSSVFRGKFEILGKKKALLRGLFFQRNYFFLEAFFVAFLATFFVAFLATFLVAFFVAFFAAFLAIISSQEIVG
jgi:ABC-type phosphate/phosphonate transport system permease subunit